MLKLRFLLPLCILAACGAEGPSLSQQPAQPQPVNYAGIVRVPAATKNGTRLLIRYAVFSDGAQIPFGLWDTRYNAPCNVGVSPAGGVNIICSGEAIPAAQSVTGFYAVGN